MRLFSAWPIAVALLLPSVAAAHVTVSPREAPAGGFLPLRFSVGHGCNETQATTALKVEIPEGVTVAHPQPKPGWTLAKTRDGNRVTAITWTGSLPADEFDEFSIFVRAPKTAGVIYFPATQSCGETVSAWVQTPQPGASGHLAFPAPKLTVTPPPPSSAAEQGAPQGANGMPGMPMPAAPMTPDHDHHE